MSVPNNFLLSRSQQLPDHPLREAPTSFRNHWLMLRTKTGASFPQQASTTASRIVILVKSSMLSLNLTCQMPERTFINGGIGEGSSRSGRLTFRLPHRRWMPVPLSALDFHPTHTITLLPSTRNCHCVAWLQTMLFKIESEPEWSTIGEWQPQGTGTT